MRTRTWSRWITSREFGPTVVIPKDSSGLAENLYIAGSAVNGDKSYYSIYPTYISTASETIACQVKTKNYDLQVGFRFKRLFWWGGDLSSVNSVSGSVAPIVYSFTVTWDQLAAYNWDQLGTWDSPLSNPVIVQTAVATNSIARRRFIKFPKSLRFRQAYFQLDMSTDGTPTTGPVRVFNIVGVISEKEHVVKQVS